MGVTATPPSSLPVPGLPLLRRGKVRDVYDLGERLLIVASDRLSAFDVVLPTPVPGKGRLLTQAALHWFKRTADLVPNHLVSGDFDLIQAALPPGVRLDRPWFEGRTMLVRKAVRVDAECVARGRLAGSAWKEYRASGTVCGEALPPGLAEGAELPRPIFTPATKADSGHDENISRARLAGLVGAAAAAELERLTLAVFARARDILATRGLVLADTKLEFGFIDGRLHLIDEVLTPDSSRVWDGASLGRGGPPAGFDKQFVRDWLERSGWDKTPPGPELPPEIVERTLALYGDFVRRAAS